MKRVGEARGKRSIHGVCIVYICTYVYMQTHTEIEGGTQARLPGCMQRAALLTESFLACALCEKTVETACERGQEEEGERERERGEGAGARRYRFKVLRIRAT